MGSTPQGTHLIAGPIEDKTPAKSLLHVLTLTPFYPFAGDEVSGCFVADASRRLLTMGVVSSVIAVSPFHYGRRQASPAAPAQWVRFPQLPGNLGLASAGLGLFARLWAEVARMHQRNPIHVIHAHAALPCGHGAALLSRRTGVPFVVTLHGLDVFNTCFQRGTATARRRAVSTKTYRAAHAVICISGKVQNVLREGMQEPVKSTVVYNGTDTDFFSPSSSVDGPDREQEVLLVGNLLVSKGHEIALRAMHRIRVHFPQLRCRIIGEGPERVRLEALAGELGISRRVRFEGRKSRKEVADAMRACTLFVLPSRYEGLGCVYLEAMACGKPVIACREQGIDEIIEHGKNGWLIRDWADPAGAGETRPPDASDELARGMMELLGSAELRAGLGRAARATIVNGLTLTDQAARLAKIYGDAAL
jgi:glycosyltransferase involved in cell wall biosynthesis